MGGARIILLAIRFSLLGYSCGGFVIAYCLGLILVEQLFELGLQGVVVLAHRPQHLRQLPVLGADPVELLEERRRLVTGIGICRFRLHSRRRRQ